MMRRTDELEAFKTRINLTEYAAAQGYLLDRKASSRNSAVMRSGSGEKIVIAKGTDKHWIYFSVQNDEDNGSIVDFVQNRAGGSLGEVRKILRPWIGESGPASVPSKNAFVADLEPITRDMARVRARFEATQPVDGHHGYLEGERAIPSRVLSDPRFEGRIRSDERGNAIFPHWNRDGICGYEIKNKGFTGFAPGGEKGLWCSRAGEGDAALVIAEAVIDALSYAAIKGTAATRFVSIGGEMNPAQPGLLQSAFKKLPAGGRFILALDNDAGGDQLSEKIRALFCGSSHAGAYILIDRPQGRGEDWNDVLRASTAKEMQVSHEP